MWSELTTHLPTLLLHRIFSTCDSTYVCKLKYMQRWMDTACIKLDLLSELRLFLCRYVCSVGKRGEGVKWQHMY